MKTPSTSHSVPVELRKDRANRSRVETGLCGSVTPKCPGWIAEAWVGALNDVADIIIAPQV